MARPEDPRLTKARQTDIVLTAERLGISGLTSVSHEWVGPCPACGGTDRFQMHKTKGVFLCRHCTPDGGDVIALVRLKLACSLTAALDWLVGDTVVTISPEEQARRDKDRAEDKAKSEAFAARARAKALDYARQIWKESVSARGTMVEDYLALRGLSAVLDCAPLKCLRYHPGLPYLVASDRRGEWDTLHHGPCMVASIISPGAKLVGVHRTWLDLNQPKGKPLLVWKDKPVSAKKYQGSTKGAAIRLFSRPQWSVLVMGEGIETTLTALMADIPPGAAYWAGLDLGNMAGKMARIPGTRRFNPGVPALDDPDDDGFVPPPWVTWLIYIQDGDSDPKTTRAKLESGLRRARARVPGLARVSIVHPGPGVDLNDLVMG